ncbi:carbohydrate binding domain-containing protein, partial [Candidatus Micrarchaeota archaeon]|nr:carbohydrate binding domain-containing protein [Candidatus Micrarchaeota archaeon]
MNECKKCILVLFFVLLIIYPLVSASDGSGPKNIFNKRYVLYSLDLSKQDGINRFIGVMDRAAAAGYNGIVLGGPYHARNYSQTMVNNTVFLVNYGRRLGLVLIPGHFDQRDPLNDVYDDLRGKNELAEAVPVVDTKFVVEEGTPLVDVLPNSGFEEWSGLQVKGLSVDALGVIAFKDVTVKHSGNASLRIQDTFLNPPYFHGRVMTSFLSVEPNRVYQLSLWVKTEGFSQPSKFKVYIRGYDENETGMNVLLDAYRAITSTQDWTEYKINFTNGNKTKLLVYFGFWVNATGKVWFDDANLSEVGFDGVSQRNPVATARMDPQVVIPNAGFEEWSATSGVPFNLSVDKLNLVIYRDTEVKHSGNTSIRIQDTFLNPPYFPGRIILNPIAVQPFRTYELSVWLKTQDVNKPDKISAYVPGYNTNGYQNLTLFTEGYSYGMGAFVSSTQNWTQYKFVINTFYETRIRVYFGLWYNTSGKVWFDDVNITELGLYNTIRRNFMPVVVESSDGNTVYQEGTDYVVRNQKLSIPTGSALSVGSELKVSWYQLGNMIDGVAPASACQERFYTELKKDAQRLNALFLNPPAFFVGYDEWRLANWDPACKELNGGVEMTGGQYMAYAMNRTEKLIKEVRPDAEVMVWNDMFDPFHNAVPNYYAVRGTVEGAWEGVSPNTIIMNWGTRQNNDARTNEPQSWSSLKFFAGRGNHQMIAG